MQNLKVKQKSVFKLAGESYKDFKKDFIKYMCFESIFKVVTSFVLMPLMVYIFHRIIKSLGEYSLSNAQIFKIGLSAKGMAGLIVLTLLATIIVFIEFGVLILISQKRHYGKSISITGAVMNTVVKTPRIIGFGSLLLSLYLLFLMPFSEFNISSSLISSIKIPKFIEEEIFKSYLYTFLYLAFSILLLWLFVRMIFTVHCIIIENKNIRPAIKKSFILTKKKSLRILFGIIIFNLMAFIAFVLIIGVILISIYLLFKAAGVGLDLDLVEYYLIIFLSEVFFIFSLVAAPFDMTFITRLYYNRRREQEDDLKDEVTVIEFPKLEFIDNKVYSFVLKRKRIITSFTAIFILGSSALGYFISDDIMLLTKSTMIAAHRGDNKYAVENSMESIKLSIEKGYDFVEIDVQDTKDRVVVLAHDKSLKRIAGVNENIKDLDYEELKNININYDYSNGNEFQRIPTLEEVLKESKGKIKLLIELKPYGDKRRLAEEVISILENYKMGDQCYIQSLDYEILQEVRNINKDIKLGYIMYLAVGDLSNLDVNFYSIEQSLLNEKFVNNAHKLNRQVWVWTVNTDEDIKEALTFGVDGLITDNPEDAKDILSGKNVN
ncbi:glycerophosphodiester phosphodiesterase [Clostridium sp. MSJ-4]|uniref:Glycerophosphodiester phosphodiesterase n=1 Tax=Clostridium simiarum TaxID=2841506 RepID=A0ABS6F0J5_9CLOT|nr:glycerophosphodiester phosphodiesterase [Clostridium simiarum]MBU5591143.1 glycerophosphodiester phosphodiesterase [Clostridium simiarum]